MKIHTMPRSILPVSQDDLSNVHVIDSQIERLARLRNTIKQSILKRMLAGAHVDAGVLDAELIEEMEAGVLKQSVRVF